MTLPTGTDVTSGPVPRVKLPAQGGGPFTNSLASVTQAGLLSTGLLEVSTVGATGDSGFARSSAEVADVQLLGVLTAQAISSSCESTTAGSTGSTTLLGASLDGSPVAANPEPNTTIQLADIGTLILNEQKGQTDFENGKTTITVNAVHLKLNTPADGKGHIIIGSSHCDVDTTAGPSTRGPLSGRAFGEKIRLTLPTGTDVSSGPLPVVGLPSTGGSKTNSLASVNQPAILSTGLLEVSTQGTTTPSPIATTSADVADVNVLAGVLTANAVSSSCESTQAGSTGSTTIVGGTLLGQPVDTNPGPNTTIPLAGIGTLILNEQKGQTEFENGKTLITVNAVHLRLNDPEGERTGDIIIASSHCDVKIPQP